MPLLKLLVDKTLEEKRFFDEIITRGQESNMVKNPFTVTSRIISADDNKMLVLLDIEPLYPDIIPKIGLFLAGVSFLFHWRVTMIAGLFLALTFFFWNDRFFYFLLKKSRKKHGLSEPGLKDRIRRLNNKEAWRGVILWDK